MAMYLMFGKSSIDSMSKEISAERTANALAVISAVGGELKAGYLLLGEPTVVLVLDLPGMKEAMKTSMELTKLTGFLFTTAPAVTLEEFNKLFEGG
jgi:uncharacterized protein with GYD domain